MGWNCKACSGSGNMLKKIMDFFKGLFRGKKKDPPAALKELNTWLEM